MSNTKDTKASKEGGQGVNQGKVTPDAALASIVGSEPLPRTEVTRRVWDYIRKNNLQDPRDKRRIRADKKLRLIFAGRDHVSMFEMTKLVNQHMCSTLPGDPTVDPDKPRRKR